jgi:tryptophan synthase alpha chain
VKRLEQTFSKRVHPALITYIMAGDPDLEGSTAVALALQEAGVDVLELGVPFSDPIADGPVIQAAGQRALNGKTTLRKVLASVEDMRARGLTIPVVLMGYINPIVKFGIATFAQEAARVGVDGVIIPDLPVDEAAELDAALEAAGVAPIQLVAPTSDDDRIKTVSARSCGFLYYVSLTGVTGIRDRLPDDVESRIHHVQSLSPVPVAVGFGVSNPEMARALGRVARGVVVGSAIVKLVEQHGKDAAAPVAEFVRKLRAALNEVEIAA